MTKRDAARNDEEKEPPFAFAFAFPSPGSFEPAEEMVGGGGSGLPAGHRMDDTSMALCLAESMIEQHGFNPVVPVA